VIASLLKDSPPQPGSAILSWPTLLLQPAVGVLLIQCLGKGPDRSLCRPAAGVLGKILVFSNQAAVYLGTLLKICLQCRFDRRVVRPT